MGIACHHVNAILQRKKRWRLKLWCKASIKTEGANSGQKGLNVTEDKAGEREKRDRSGDCADSLSIELHMKRFLQGLLPGAKFLSVVFQIAFQMVPGKFLLRHLLHFCLFSIK